MMTYSELVRKAWFYNQKSNLKAVGFVIIFVATLIPGCVSGLSGNIGLLALFFAIAAWAGYKAFKTSPAETEQESLCNYINRLLKKAAQKKYASLVEEDEKAVAGISMYERKRHRILRTQAFNLEQDIQGSLAEVAEELKTCEATLRRMHDRKSVTAAKIKTFEYELDVLKKNAEKAVYNHYANPKTSEDSDLAESVEGLRKSAAAL